MILKQVLLYLLEHTRSLIVAVWILHPYSFELALFLLALFVLFLIAFIKTQPPKGLVVHYGPTDLGQMIKIAIENNTGSDLTECYLEIRKITGELEQDYWPNLPLNCSYIENNKYVTNKLAIIPDNKNLQFWVASPSNESDIGFLLTWESHNTFRFKKQIKVEYRFFGKSSNGDSKKKDFEVTFQSLGRKTWITKIWE